MDTLQNPDLQAMNWADYWDTLTDKYFAMLAPAGAEERAGELPQVTPSQSANGTPTDDDS